MPDMLPSAELCIYHDEPYMKYCVSLYRLGFNQDWESEICQMAQEAGIESKAFEIYVHRILRPHFWADVWESNIWFRNQTDAAKFYLLYA